MFRMTRELSTFFATKHLFTRLIIFLPRGLLPLEPSIYNMDSGSSLSVWSLGYSIEIPAVLTSPDSTDPDGFVPSSNPLPLTLAEINAESQDHLAQEFIDRLDMVCRSAITSSPRPMFCSDAGARGV